MAFRRLAKLLQGDTTERRPRPLDVRSTMPYKQITQLPDSVKNNLPKGAQEIYKEAFKSAEEQYGEEDRAHRVAWSAVENKYEKNEKGDWVKKNS
jgi:cation transport regulator